MSNLGIIKLNGKVYGYDAYYDEEKSKWYAEICNGKGETIQTSEAIYDSYASAIQSAARWIKADSKN